MSDQRTGFEDHGVHSRVWEILPWYVNASLGDEELLQVEAHLRRCDACAEEVAFLRGLAEQVVQMAPVVPSPDEGWTQMLASIRDRDGGTRPTRAAAVAGSGSLRRTLHQLLQLPVPFRWLLLGQSVLLLALVVVLWPRMGAGTGKGLYRTLAEPTPSVEQVSVGPRVRIVFADDSREAEIRRLLTELGAGIVAGPTAYGVYTLELDSSLTRQQLEIQVDRLREAPGVRFVEIIR